MNLLNQLVQVFKNFASLGQARLITLIGVGVASMAIILFAAMYVNKPTYETLYVGLETNDLNQISIALSESGVDFEVGTDGKSLRVPAGSTSKARLLLAERGLPNSANAGYELFDNVGSLGLTSFMQEVTRVRALEGEIGRTIQTINGINAARATKFPRPSQRAAMPRQAGKKRTATDGWGDARPKTKKEKWRSRRL